MNIIRLLLKLIFVVSLAFAGLLLLIQRDQWFLQAIETRVVKEFSNAFQCAMRARVKRVNLFVPSIELEDVYVASATTTNKNTPEWHWCCKRYTATSSWLSFVRTGKFVTTMTLTGFEARSTVKETTPAIMSHLNALLFEPSVMPITLRALRVRNGTILLTEMQKELFFTLRFNSNSLFKDAAVKSSVALTMARLYTGDRAYIHCSSGTIHCVTQQDAGKLAITGNGMLTATSDYLPSSAQPYTITGSWKNDQGSCEIHNDQAQIAVTLDKVSDALLAQLKGTIPVQYIAQAADYNSFSSSGLLEVKASANLYDLENSLEGTIAARKLVINSYTVDSIESTFYKKKSLFKGECRATYNQKLTVSGVWQFDQAQEGLQLTAFNNNSIKLPNDFSLKPGASAISVYYNSKTRELSGQAKASLTSAADREYKLKAVLSGTQESATITIQLNNEKIVAKGALNPFKLTEVSYVDSDGVTQGRLTQKGQQLEGSVSLDVIKKVAQMFTALEISGEGSVHIKTRPSSKDLSFSIELVDGTIKIPTVYNVIQKIKALITLDLANRIVTAQQIDVGLHRGAIRCIEATVQFDETGHCSFAHAPCVLQNCFISWQKNLFGIISGSCLATYKQDNALIKGRFIIERSHLKGNLLSDEFAQQTLSTPKSSGFLSSCMLDLTFLTRKPLQVKTSFLEAEALLEGAVQGTVQDPKVTGVVEITKGSLAFPYKPLYITRSKLYISPQDITNPTIELHAYNKVKKFDIMLDISGSLKKPLIIFSSSPALTEEQIITLLFTGSEEAALTAVFPAMIMQTIHNLLFGPAERTGRIQKYIKTLLQRFNYLRIVPSYNDQEGLRASLEVELSDRLRGSIQKNFTMPEDTKIEVEYDLSDEISVRGVKDERGDMGAEIEMRFKF